MTRIKFCGLLRECDIKSANELLPEYIGFVFWPGSIRYVSPEIACRLRKFLADGIHAVGVFVDEKPENISALTQSGIIDIIQLHGHEDNEYISRLRKLTGKTIIKAFKVTSPQAIILAMNSTADYVMLDSGAGTGKAFDWSLIHEISRPYFLAGGLTSENVRSAVNELKPFAVDVSSGIETDGIKDKAKMTAFVKAVRAG